MQETTETEFDDSWDKFKEESPFQTKAVVCNYFEKNLATSVLAELIYLGIKIC